MCPAVSSAMASLRTARATRGTVVLALALIGGIVVLMLPGFDRPAGVFDEGTLLAYPVRVLQGDVPHRDFVTFYGPGGPWLLAAVYEVFGATQVAERVVGLGYCVVIATSAFVLCLRWGRMAAFAAGGTAAVMLVGFELTASASLGALACGLAALALIARTDQPARPGAMLAGGLLVGIGMLMRLDFAPALLLASVPFLRGALPRARWRYLLGLSVGLAAYAFHAAIVGPDKIGRVASDLVTSGPGRRLPIEPLSSQPGRLLVLCCLAIAAAALLAMHPRLAAEPPGSRRTFAALALLSAALLPFATSRLDYVHIVPAALPTVSVLPAAATLVGSRLAPRGAWIGAGATAVLLVATLIALAPTIVGRPLKLHLNHLLGRTGNWSELVKVDGRGFRIGRGEAATRVRAVVRSAERARRAGARTLFVGQEDLRESNKNDVDLYYLLADFQPASYYMELNPLTANRGDSPLADELRRADVLI